MGEVTVKERSKQGCVLAKEVLEGQMPTAIDFDRLAAVLRAVSERLTR